MISNQVRYIYPASVFPKLNHRIGCALKATRPTDTDLAGSNVTSSTPSLTQYNQQTFFSPSMLGLLRPELHSEVGVNTLHRYSANNRIYVAWGCSQQMLTKTRRKVLDWLSTEWSTSGILGVVIQDIPWKPSSIRSNSTYVPSLFDSSSIPRVSLKNWPYYISSIARFARVVYVCRIIDAAAGIYTKRSDMHSTWHSYKCEDIATVRRTQYCN